MYKRTRGTQEKAQPSLTVRLYRLQSPEIAETLAELHAHFGKYALPDEALRKLVDKSMGNRTLTQELYAMREGR